MLALLELQGALRDALLDGNTKRILREVDERGVGAVGALAIYRNHVRISLTAALRTTFPVVCRLVDERFFAFAAHAYIQANPPAGPCLAEYGSSFPDFLTSFAPCRGLPYVADVARLEWALNLAQIAPHVPRLDHPALAALPSVAMPRVVFTFNPSVRLLASAYPVDRIWRANQEPVQAGVVELGGASRLQIHRAASGPTFKSLGPAEFLFSQALHLGLPLGEAAEGALAADPMFDLAFELRRMIQDDVISGFTLAEKEKTP
ncbi:MAG TPA: DNA-binding domain-containing protein [Alphaproteobacteria bacterium]|nr:DNA-binding domain-containing protein [Alphaproteobacteria bacterium]